MKKSLYDVRLAISEYLKKGGVPVVRRSDDSSMCSVSLDVSMILEPSESESGLTFGYSIVDGVMKQVRMPFLLSVLLYAGKSEDIAKSKHNIEKLYIETFHLLKELKGIKGVEFRYHTLRSMWVRNPILAEENSVEATIRISMEGVAVYE